jgi:putative intracellular protease/amidase
MKQRTLFKALVLLAALCGAAAACRAQTPAPPQNVAILVFDGVQIIDYTGPYEVFGHMRPSNVYTVAERAEPLTTAMGMKVVPSYTFANSPKPDILVVPGGSIEAALASPKLIAWIQAGARDARHVLSVCNGAFLLARAGLLDGLTATTTAPLLNQLREFAPKTKVVGHKRFVDNGKIVTSAGLSAGIDGALHIVSKVRGPARAMSLARGIEYNWDPDSKYARGAMPDMFFHQAWMDVFMLGPSDTLRHDGDNDRWELVQNVKSDSPERVFETFAGSLVGKERWQRRDVKKEGGTSTGDFNFTDELGRPWRGTLTVKPSGKGGEVTLTFAVNRAA